MARYKYTFTWKRVLIELLIVAAGVLLALALDQWMDSRKDRAEETLLLRAVRAELRAVVAELDEELVFRQALNQSIGRVFEMSEANPAPDGSDLDPVLGNLLWWSYAEFPTGATESILVGGKLPLIRNEEIRYFLAALPKGLGTIRQVESNSYATLVDVAMPYLRRNADLPQIAATISSRPGSKEDRPPYLSASPRAKRSHAELLNQSEFLGIVVHIAAANSNVILRYNELRPRVERIISLLDAELGDQ